MSPEGLAEKLRENFQAWRSEENPLDLNNLPEDYTRDGKQVSEDSSSSAERETETLNKARQLVFTNDLAPGHLGYVSGGQTIPHGGYHQAGNMAGDFRSMYPTRLFSTSSSLIPPPPPPPPPQPQASAYMYASPPRLLSTFPSHQYPGPAPPVNDYFVGHVLSNGTSPVSEGNHYTCIGAPVGHGFGNTGGGGGGVRDVSLQNQEEGLSWGRR
ncbi:Zinc finger protein JAGGED [Sesamum alatum]|uniref:Zinc finger protein JAGGED n=1 Tax=Sesamum alatum TaxID=300844 RepID=A0AAE2CQ02_9LAMI|nr:Zinc finger protein JAGGED [Sesamum alatum]